MFFNSCGHANSQESDGLPVPELLHDEIAVKAVDGRVENITMDTLSSNADIDVIYSPATGCPRQIDGTFSPHIIQSEEDALIALLSVRDIFHIPDDCSFCSAGMDEDRVDHRVYLFNQLYQGVTVNGALFRVVTTKEGVPVSVGGIYQQCIDVNVVPALSYEDGVKLLPLGDKTDISAISLVIYCDADDLYHLCWRYETKSARLSDCKIYYVDAHDASLVGTAPTAVS